MQRRWIAWIAIGAVAVLCATLGFLQYRWIGAVSDAERTRLHDELQSELMSVSRTLSREASLSELPAAPGLADFDIQVVTTGPHPTLAYTTGPRQIWTDPDASVPVFDFPPDRGPGPEHRGPPPTPPDHRFEGRHGPPDHLSPDRGPPHGPGRGPDRARWRILAKHKSGSLEDLVAATRRRNLFVSGAILLLILGITAMLMRVTQQAQLLADAHVGFLAGVSHELRTPLTVIRTAAFNLTSGKIGSPEQIERYGRLIAGESGKLEALVDQVLRYAGGRAGFAVGERKPIALAPLIEDEVNALRASAERDGVRIDLHIAPDLPLALADQQALRHAVRNLLDNALRYGCSGGSIGISAKRIATRGVTYIEVEIDDRGPGIPASEIDRIFEPFFRGSRAVRDQIHGTGLGLNIVRSIAEAHGGSISVTSEPDAGTHFFLRIPCAENQT